MPPKKAPRKDEPNDAGLPVVANADRPRAMINIAGDGVKAIRIAARTLRVPQEAVVELLVRLASAQSSLETRFCEVKSKSTTGTPHAIYEDDLAMLTALGERHGGPPEAVLSAFAQSHAVWLMYATATRPMQSALHFRGPRPRE